MTAVYKYQEATVASIYLGLEDHGVLTTFVNLHFDGSISQSYGGYSLDTYDAEVGYRVGTAFGCEVIVQMLRFFRVAQLSDAAGTRVIAIRRAGSDIIARLLRLPEHGGAMLDFAAIASIYENTQGKR